MTGSRTVPGFGAIQVTELRELTTSYKEGRKNVMIVLRNLQVAVLAEHRIWFLIDDDLREPYGFKIGGVFMIRYNKSKSTGSGKLAYYYDNLDLLIRAIQHTIKSMDEKKRTKLLKTLEGLESFRENLSSVSSILGGRFELKRKLKTFGEGLEDEKSRTNLINASNVAAKVVAGVDDIAAVIDREAQRAETSVAIVNNQIDAFESRDLLAVMMRDLNLELIRVQMVVSQDVSQSHDVFGDNATEAGLQNAARGLEGFAKELDSVLLLRPFVNVRNNNVKDMLLAAKLMKEGENLHEARMLLDKVFRACYCFLHSRSKMTDCISLIGSRRANEVISGELLDQLMRSCQEIVVVLNTPVGIAMRMDDDFETHFVSRMTQALTRLIDRMGSDEGCRVDYFKRNLRRFEAVH